MARRCLYDDPRHLHLLTRFPARDDESWRWSDDRVQPGRAGSTRPWTGRSRRTRGPGAGAPCTRRPASAVSIASVSTSSPSSSRFAAERFVAGTELCRGSPRRAQLRGQVGQRRSRGVADQRGPSSAAWLGAPLVLITAGQAAAGVVPEFEGGAPSHDVTKGGPGVSPDETQSGRCAAAATSAPVSVFPSSGANRAVTWSNVASPSSRMRSEPRWSCTTTPPVGSSVAAARPRRRRRRAGRPLRRRVPPPCRRPGESWLGESARPAPAVEDPDPVRDPPPGRSPSPWPMHSQRPGLRPEAIGGVAGGSALAGTNAPRPLTWSGSPPRRGASRRWPPPRRP